MQQYADTEQQGLWFRCDPMIANHKPIRPLAAILDFDGRIITCLADITQEPIRFVLIDGPIKTPPANGRYYMITEMDEWESECVFGFMADQFLERSGN